MLSPDGKTFSCHKTVKYDDDGDCGTDPMSERHCAGAIIFAEKNGNVTQAMRMAERFRFYKIEDFTKDKKVMASVFDTEKEMLKVNKREQMPKRKLAKKKA